MRPVVFSTGAGLGRGSDPSAGRGTLVGRVSSDPLASFNPQVRDWFVRSFERPTEAQARAWPAIASGQNVLVSAPTGSGKTLAAFLWGLDRLVTEPDSGRLVYVSPLKALSYDIEKNLRAPLKGIGGDVSVAIRTGDTPQRERQAMLRTPPDVLITTPESPSPPCSPSPWRRRRPQRSRTS